jgi:[ribosomal protein S18]-alanine N-acetyltransferase
MKADGASVRVRRMAAEDLDRVVELAARLPEAPRWPDAAYRAALNPESRPQRVSLVAEEVPTAGIIGFAIASLLPPQAELETIAVATNRRRHGVGRQLFQAVAAELGLEGANEIWLEVRASNGTAIAFYVALGFAKAGLRRVYYADPIEDAVQMALKLT